MQREFWQQRNELRFSFLEKLPIDNPFGVGLHCVDEYPDVLQICLERYLSILLPVAYLHRFIPMQRESCQIRLLLS